MKRLSDISRSCLHWLPILAVLACCFGFRNTGPDASVPAFTKQFTSIAYANALSTPEEEDALSSADDELDSNGMLPAWIWLNSEPDKDPVMDAQAHIKCRQARHFEITADQPATAFNTPTVLHKQTAAFPEIKEPACTPYYYIFLFRLTLF